MCRMGRIDGSEWIDSNPFPSGVDRVYERSGLPVAVIIGALIGEK